PDHRHRIVQPVELPAGGNPELLGFAAPEFLMQPIASSPAIRMLRRQPTQKPEERPREGQRRWVDHMRVVGRGIRGSSTENALPLERLEYLRRLARQLRRLLDSAPALTVSTDDLALIRDLGARIERLCEMLRELMRRAHEFSDVAAQAVAQLSEGPK